MYSGQNVREVRNSENMTHICVIAGNVLMTAGAVSFSMGKSQASKKLNFTDEIRHLWSYKNECCRIQCSLNAQIWWKIVKSEVVQQSSSSQMGSYPWLFWIVFLISLKYKYISEWYRSIKNQNLSLQSYPTCLKALWDKFIIKLTLQIPDLSHYFDIYDQMKLTFGLKLLFHMKLELMRIPKTVLKFR